jgi:hypothetical protein
MKLLFCGLVALLVAVEAEVQDIIGPTSATNVCQGADAMCQMCAKDHATDQGCCDHFKGQGKGCSWEPTGNAAPTAAPTGAPAAAPTP